MQALKCPACGGTAFHRVRGAPLLASALFRIVAVVASVCLTCGLITTHVEESALARLRARILKAKDATAGVPNDPPGNL